MDPRFRGDDGLVLVQPLKARFAALVGVEHDEIVPLALGFALFFLLFAGYFMLRPVRETMGIAGGVDNLPWLFLATFLATLAIVPAFGWLSARVARARLLPWSYALVALSLGGFALAMAARPEDPWIARGFYIWLSVINLFVVSLAWSFMADILTAAQARRLFGPIAAGASVGGLAGPVLGGLLVPVIGHAGLLASSAALMAATLALAPPLLRWRQARPDDGQAEEGPPARPIGGRLLAGVALIGRSRQLQGIALFVVLLAAVSTFLYLEQARLVEAAFPDRTRQTQVFAAIDALVQTLTIAVQLFVTGRLTRRLGVTVLLTAVPIAMAAGFLVLAVAPAFAVLAVVMVVRRVGEYALVRPGREMLFAPLDAETKYKAKNVIDTAVYRGGDAVSAWAKAGMEALGSGLAVALGGAALAALWAFVGARIGRAAADGAKRSHG